MGDGKDNILHDFRHQVGKGLDEMGIEDDHLTVHKKYDVGQPNGQIPDVCIQDAKGSGILLPYQFDKLINVLQRRLQVQVPLVYQLLV